MGAIESFIGLVDDICDEGRCVGFDRAGDVVDGRGTRGSQVMPVVPKGINEEKVNVFWARIGGSVITAMNRRRQEFVELQWTVIGPVWQDCDAVNEAIIKGLFDRRALQGPDGGVAPPEDDAFPSSAGDAPIFTITSSATLRDTDW